MSVTTLTQITCDGPSVGTTCVTAPAIEDLSVANTRRELAKQGWKRRHDGDRAIDLCSFCDKQAVLAPHTNGRPRKSV